MPEAAHPDRICVGAISGAFGVQGEVRLKSFCSTPEDIAAYGPLWSEDGTRQFKIKLTKPDVIYAIIVGGSNVAFYKQLKAAGIDDTLEVTAADGESVRKPDESEPFAALAFKIMADPYVGKLTYFRVYSGKLSAGSRVLNVSTGRTERIGRILMMHANEREELEEVYAGDIAAAVGIKQVITGDTLAAPDASIQLENIVFPEPVRPRPSTFRFASAAGIVAAWIGNGSTAPSSASAFVICSPSRSSARWLISSSASAPTGRRLIF